MSSPAIPTPTAPKSPLPARLFGACLDTKVQTRVDGTVLLQSAQPLLSVPQRLSDSLLHGATHHPQRSLVARREGGSGDWLHISYGQMLQRARGIGQWLLGQGLSVDRPVAILSDNDLEHLTLALGAMWVGVPVVPISPAYSLLSQDFGKLRHIMGVTTPGLVFAAGARFAKAIAATAPADATVVLTTLPNPAETAALRQTLGARQLTDFATLLATPASAAADTAQAATGPQTVVKFLFTSGSTKDPKGVVNTHGMLCANQQMLRQVFTFLADEPPVLVDWLPWNHTFGGNHNVGLVLYNGGTLYIDDGKPTASGIAQTLVNLREVAPTMYFNVPKGFEELVTAMEGDATLRQRLFSRVRVFMYAGAGLAQAVWDQLDAQAVATRGERVPMITGLGMTETAPSCTFAVGSEVKSGHIGLPCPGVVCKLVPNAEGSGKTEVRFRGPNVMPGYWRAPAQTAAAFDDEGFYCTGDAVVWIDPLDPQRGLAFDGRIAEDFKLSSGTFVSVGPLRATVTAAGAPLVQDVVVAGINRNDIGLLVFPRPEEIRRHFNLGAELTARAVLNHGTVLAYFQTLLDTLWQRGTGSANRPARLLLLAEPPHIDRGEVTDKGSINQRAVLIQRAALVAHLWGEAEADQPGATDPLPPVLRPRQLAQA